jgi:hypothetical protein
MFRTTKHLAVFAICVCFGGSITSAAAASVAVGHGGGSHFSAAVRAPGGFQRTFRSVRDRGSAIRTLGNSSMYGGYSFYEGMGLNDQRDNGGNCWVERRVFEDFEFRRVRPVVVCD